MLVQIIKDVGNTSITGCKQPYPINILPSNVHRPLVWTLVKVCGKFGEHRSISAGTNKLQSAILHIRGSLFPCGSLLAELRKPQRAEKYLRTTSHYGVNFVPIMRTFVTRFRYEVRFTILTPQILFCGISC